MGSTGRVGSVRLRRHTPRGRAERVPAGGRVGCLPPGAAPQSPAGPLSTPGAAPAPRSWWAARCHIPRSLVCPLPCSSPPSRLPVLQVLLRAPRGCPSTPVSGRPAWPGPMECAGCRSGYWLPCSPVTSTSKLPREAFRPAGPFGQAGCWSAADRPR